MIKKFKILNVDQPEKKIGQAINTKPIVTVNECLVDTSKIMAVYVNPYSEINELTEIAKQNIEIMKKYNCIEVTIVFSCGMKLFGILVPNLQYIEDLINKG